MAAGGISIDVRADIRQLTRGFDRLRREQIPFATARTLTTVASRVADAQTSAIRTNFKTPTPFTQRAIGVKPARKTALTATIFVRDIQATYLAPYLDPNGGVQVLGAKRAILAPVQVALNQYGNIPRGKLAALKGMPGVFIGQVKTKAGKVISGVWQRPTPALAGKGRRIKGANTTGHLKLLIEFTDPKPVGQNLDYAQRATKIIAGSLQSEWDKNMAQALASAR